MWNVNVFLFGTERDYKYPVWKMIYRFILVSNWKFWLLHKIRTIFGPLSSKKSEFGPKKKIRTIVAAVSLLQIQLCLSDTILWSNIGPIILVQSWSNNSSCLVCCIKQEYIGIHQQGLMLIPMIIVHLLDYKAL